MDLALFTRFTLDLVSSAGYRLDELHLKGSPVVSSCLALHSVLLQWNLDIVGKAYLAHPDELHDAL